MKDIALHVPLLILFGILVALIFAVLPHPWVALAAGWMFLYVREVSQEQVKRKQSFLNLRSWAFVQGVGPGNVEPRVTDWQHFRHKHLEHAAPAAIVALGIVLWQRYL